MTATRGTAFTTTMRVIDRVLGNAARQRTTAQPAVAACLGKVLVAVVRIADRADRAHALAANVALLARVQANDDQAAITAGLEHAHGNAVVMIDGGTRQAEGRGEVGRAVIVPYLQSIGVNKIDALVVTHADSDHCNALPSVLHELPVGLVIDGAASTSSASPGATGSSAAPGGRRDGWRRDIRYTRAASASRRSERLLRRVRGAQACERGVPSRRRAVRDTCVC